MSFFGQLVEKLPGGIKHARDELIGVFNPDRRHDEPHEQEMDKVRQEIRDAHRFNSFAEQRTKNCVKWHVDGHDYMWALSEFLESAEEAIFILDWWLSPELYLRRPPELHQQWRLDRVLKRKAEQGVKIYVVVYKEVTQTMSMSSSYTKHYLDDLHPNIVCLRHPDHIGSKDSVQFWSHHEKVVVVDNHFACIGGLDLCYGRWDTQTHPLADVHPTDWNKTLFPGQDYNNARIMDFKDVNQFASNTLSVLESARMPWHDNHMTLTGPVVLDIVQHFVERWNEIKKRKYRYEERVEWLALPHNVEAAPNEAVARHPNREDWHSMGRRYKNRWHQMVHGDEEGEENEHERRAYRRDSLADDPWGFTCNVQVCRSVSDWSHGVLVEHSIQNAYIELINEAEHFIYIENQFFISATKDGEQIKNKIAGALVNRIVRAHQEGTKFKVFIAIPELPGFAGNVKDESSLQFIMAGQYRTINRGGSSIYEQLWKAGIEPLSYIRFYHLRAYDRINAPSEYIKAAEESSGVKFHEALVAMARQWTGENSKQKQVKFINPKETKEGLVDGNKVDQDIITVDMPESEEDAEATLRKFEDAAKAIRGDEDVADNVVQHMLLDNTSLEDEKWLGSEEEELNAYITELLYIHSKLMIVDDRRVIMGSANINDRSQKGDGDSEIALIVEDTAMIDSKMDGQDYKAAKFAATLRRKLYREHLGLIPPQRDEVTSFMRPAPHPYNFAEEFNGDEDAMREAEAKVIDPLSDETQFLVIATAHKNREMFEDVFRTVPSNRVRNWKAYDEYLPNIKKGHVAPGIDLATVKSKLSQIRGSLVEAPLDFLIEEKDFVQGPAWDGLNPTLPIYI